MPRGFLHAVGGTKGLQVSVLSHNICGSPFLFPNAHRTFYHSGMYSRILSLLVHMFASPRRSGGPVCGTPSTAASFQLHAFVPNYSRDAIEVMTTDRAQRETSRSCERVWSLKNKMRRLMCMACDFDSWLARTAFFRCQAYNASILLCLALSRLMVSTILCTHDVEREIDSLVYTCSLSCSLFSSCISLLDFGSISRRSTSHIRLCMVSEDNTTN